MPPSDWVIKKKAQIKEMKNKRAERKKQKKELKKAEKEKNKIENLWRNFLLEPLTA